MKHYDHNDHLFWNIKTRLHQIHVSGYKWIHVSGVNAALQWHYDHLCDGFSRSRDLLNVPGAHEVSQVPEDQQHGVSEVRQDGDDQWRLLKQLEVTAVRGRTTSRTGLHTIHVRGHIHLQKDLKSHLFGLSYIPTPIYCDNHLCHNCAHLWTLETLPRYTHLRSWRLYGL